MRSTRGYIKERFSGVFIQRLGLRSSPISPVDIKRRTFTKGNYKKKYHSWKVSDSSSDIALHLRNLSEGVIHPQAHEVWCPLPKSPHYSPHNTLVTLPDRPNAPAHPDHQAPPIHQQEHTFGRAEGRNERRRTSVWVTSAPFNFILVGR